MQGTTDTDPHFLPGARNKQRIQSRSHAGIKIYRLVVLIDGPHGHKHYPGLDVQCRIQLEGQIGLFHRNTAISTAFTAAMFPFQFRIEIDPIAELRSHVENDAMRIEGVAALTVTIVLLKDILKFTVAADLGIAPERFKILTLFRCCF